MKDASWSRPGGDTRSIESCSDAVRDLPEWEDDEQLDNHDDGMGSMFDTGESQMEVIAGSSPNDVVLQFDC